MNKFQEIFKAVVEIIRSDDVEDTHKVDDNPQVDPKVDDTDAPKDAATIVKTEADEPSVDTADEPKADNPTPDNPTPDSDPVTEPKEPEKGVDLDNPERRVITTLAGEDGYIVGFSIQGRSHISDGTPCEDYHYYTELAPGWKLPDRSV